MQIKHYFRNKDNLLPYSIFKKFKLKSNWIPPRSFNENLNKNLDIINKNVKELLNLQLRSLIIENYEKIADITKDKFISEDVKRFSLKKLFFSKKDEINITEDEFVDLI